jgi:ubiquinone/menaquinone biosynthesis C-methylase UbiE
MGAADMSKTHRAVVERQFGRTVEAFARLAVRDTPEVVAEKVQFMRPQAGDVALDVACGPGTLVLELAARVRWARGLDVTREMLEQARRFQAARGLTNVGFERGEADQLPYRDQAFDLVVCQCSLHHMSHPERAIQEMIRVLQPAGRLAIIDTLAPEQDAKFELLNRIEIARDPSHVATLRWTTFRRMFDEFGLEVVDEQIRRRERRFHHWMLRAGHDRGGRRYEQTRRLLEASIPGDRAGLSPRREGDDFVITHYEGMFLLQKKAGGPVNGGRPGQCAGEPRRGA